MPPLACYKELAQKWIQSCSRNSHTTFWDVTIRIKRLETTILGFLDKDRSDRFNIVIGCSRDAALLEETINFLRRTGMPPDAYESIIIRSLNNEYYQYFDALDKDFDFKYVYNRWNSLQDIPNFSRASYSLFLTSGAKISWGSVECLYRAAQEKPDASFISAVFRGRTGRVVFPNESRTINGLLQYCKSWFLPKNFSFISSLTFFKEAVLIRNNILDMSYNQFQNKYHNLPLIEAKHACIIICVPAAQLISLGHGVK